MSGDDNPVMANLERLKDDLERYAFGAVVQCPLCERELTIKGRAQYEEFKRLAGELERLLHE